MEKVLVTEDYLSDIADAIREKNSGTEKYKPSEMAAAISALNTSGETGGSTAPTVAEWTRPDGWANLDAIDMSDFEGIYATYMVDPDVENFISMYGGSSGVGLTIEEVSVAEDGTVSVVQEIETITATSGSVVITRADINGLAEGAHTFRITGFSVAFSLASSYGINGTGTVGAQLQNMVEMYVRLPTVTASTTYANYIATRSVEHIKIVDTPIVNFNESLTGASGSMFTNANNLEKLEFDNSPITFTGGSAANMFSGCYALTSLDLSGFDTSSVTSMTYMFSGCYALTSLDLSGFDTSSVTTMGNMFSGCYALTSLDLSGFDTSSVTTMGNMFQNCYALTSLDLSNSVGAATMTSWLTSVSALQKLTIGAFKYSFSISQSTLYSADTLAAILEALATVESTCTITMGNTNKAKLTDEQIAVATDKGWTVA